jgi:O-antigen ligase
MRYRKARKKAPETRDPRGVIHFLVVLYLLTLPFVVSVSGLDKFRLPKGVFTALAVPLLLAVVLLSGRLRKWDSWKSWEGVLLAAWAFVGLHTLVSGDPLLSAWAFFYLTLFVALYWVFFSGLDREMYRAAFLAMGAATAVHSVLTMFQYHGWITGMVYESGEVVAGRLTPAGLIGDVNSGGFLFGLSVLLLVPCIVVEKSRAVRVAATVLLLLNLVGLAYTRTLTALGALLVCAVLWLAFHHWWRLRTWEGARNWAGGRRDLVVLWIVLVVGGAAGVGVAYQSGMASRIVEVAGQARRGNLTFATAGRQPVYWLTWQMIREEPWLGRGLDTFGRDFFHFRTETEEGQSVRLIHQPGAFREVHNDFLQTWEELGVVGLLFLVALLALPVVRSFRLVPRLTDPRDAYWTGVLTLVIPYLFVVCLGFFPLRVTVTGAYVVLALAALRTWQKEAKPRRVAWGRWAPLWKRATVGALAVLMVVLGYQEIRRWQANAELGTGSYLLERLAAGAVPAERRRATAGQVLGRLARFHISAARMPELYNLRGTALLSLGRYEEAAENYRLAAEYVPSPEVYTNLAAAFLSRRDLEQATEYVRLALRYDPEYGKARRALELLEKNPSP